MGVMVFHTVKVVATAVISALCCYLFLLWFRIPLCDDIEQSTGRHVFKNKRKPHKEYPNYLRHFLLSDYRQYMKGWHYALFLLDILLSFALVTILTTIVALDWNPTLGRIGELILFLFCLVNLVRSLLPSHRHRPRKNQRLH